MAISEQPIEHDPTTSWRLAERGPTASQQPVEPHQILAMCERAFGAGVRVASVVELGLGTYNNTYRVDIGTDRPVILRVAPEPSRQFRSERDLMRNEYATVPYLAPIAAMVPRTLAADFTHDIIGRDYMFQTLLEGVPAPEGLGAYPRPAWASFFRQLGTIARRIHEVRGDGFGPVAGPTFATWSEALIAYLEDVASDLDSAGLDAADVRQVAATAASQPSRDVLDEIAEPRLLHGDLWTVNVMIEPAAPEPTICGVLDGDRSCWGDPEADWTIRMAGRRPGTERDAFWETYGQLGSTAEARLRRLFYHARHIAGIRVERHRLGRLDALSETYDDLRDVLAQIGA